MPLPCYALARVETEHSHKVVLLSAKSSDSRSALPAFSFGTLLRFV